MKLTEHIRHGDYESRQSTTITGELTKENILGLLDRSPYYGNHRAMEDLFGEDLADRLLFDIKMIGRANFGWADYYLEEN